MIVGPPDSGKTTFLYRLIFQKDNWASSKTTGFQFEEVRGGEGPNPQEVGVWDVGGGQSTQLVL